MKIKAIANTHFQKQLKANCTVIGKNNNPEQCNVYKLEFGKDDRYFSNLRKTSDWENSEFLDYAIFQLPRKEVFNSDTYTLENKKGECLGFCEFTTIEGGIIEVIETCPKYKKEYKYIGETLLTFLVKQATEKSLKTISLTSKERTKHFYKKQGFTETMGNEMCLYEKDYKKTIQNNEKHTGTNINFTT